MFPLEVPQTLVIQENQGLARRVRRARLRDLCDLVRGVLIGCKGRLGASWGCRTTP